jgi:hypothetical protein
MAERPGDPLAMEWIAAAAVASVVAAASGTLIAGKDFLINILASVTLLGPGLFFTNVIARNWRVARAKSQLLYDVSPPVFDLVFSVDHYLIDPMIELLEGASGRNVIKVPWPQDQLSLPERLETITNNLTLITDEAHAYATTSHESHYAVSPLQTAVHDFMRRIIPPIALLESRIRIPISVLALKELQDRFDSAHILVKPYGAADVDNPQGVANIKLCEYEYQRDGPTDLDTLLYACTRLVEEASRIVNDVRHALPR